MDLVYSTSSVSILLIESLAAGIVSKIVTSFGECTTFVDEGRDCWLFKNVALYPLNDSESVTNKINL